MKHKELNEFWSTSFYVFENTEHEKYKEEILDYLYDLKGTGDDSYAVAGAAKGGSLFETHFKLFQTAGEKCEGIKQIYDFCHESVGQVVIHKNEMVPPNSEVMVLDSWAHITNDGGFHDTHNHPNCSWCGIYCIEKGNSNQKNQNGINRFHSPLNSSMVDAGNYYLRAGAWDWEPMDGHLLVFPSYLMHSALPYNGDIDRIVISFNSTTVVQQEAI